MRLTARALILAAMLASLSSVASAYYHWTYFVSHNGPFVPIRAKFDLTGLPNRSISYFISDQPPSTLVPGDNYDSLLSEIRLAAGTWDQISTSQVRLRFGGISTVGTPQAAPGIDVVFDDNMPPGLFAQTTVTTPTDLTYLNGADPSLASVPILRSRLQLRSDLTTYQQASFSDSFFMTIVHEFGHTLGLQHSLTSATMSTSLTRATTKALPLSADDIAGISVLYPTATFAKKTGSITGQVSVGGNGMSLASVVALATNGIAIGAMTNPDGTYRIDGLPPGDYYVYAHPLPPAQQGETLPAAIMPALDPDGQPFPIDTSFDTQFFPGAHLVDLSSTITITAATGVTDINFNLQSRPAGSPIYDLRMYGYFGPDQVPIHAPPLVSGDRRWMVFTAPGLFSGTTTNITPGLRVSVIGSAAQLEPSTLAYYTAGYLMMVVDANAVSAATPVAVAVTTPADLYVLPAAFSVVTSQPPVIDSISGVSDAQGNATVTIAGENLDTSMRFLFDGVAATGIKINGDATVSMSAPAATGAHIAAVEILGSDGQTSSQALGANLPPAFTYAAPDNPFLAIDQANLTAGTDTMIEIRGFNTNFNEDTVVGFGSSDITVRKTWFMDPGRLLLNISLGPAANPGPAAVTVATGLQVVTLNTIQILPPNAQPMSLRAPVLNADTGLPGVPRGGNAMLGSSGLPANLTGWTLKISDVSMPFTIDAVHQLHFEVPWGLRLGPAVVRLIPPAGDPIPPVLLDVNPPPPVIVSATGPDGTYLDDDDFVKPGDVITVAAASLGEDPSSVVPASQVRVFVGGVEQMPSSVTAPDVYLVSQIVFTLPAGLPAGSQQPITVRVRTRLSDPYLINLASAPPPPPPAASTTSR